MRLAVVAAAALLCMGCVWCESVGTGGNDRITSLPGLDTPLDFNMYSGYVNVDQEHDRELFYWFVESANKPSTDPLIVWLQGGPGCSSLIGLFMENGPLLPKVEGGGVEPNPFSWNTFANVLYIDAPAGVGFSFSENKTDYNTNNNKTSADNYAFLQLWFERFPEYKNVPLYITGESYAGDYVPQLALRILQGSDTGMIERFAGFAIGNPVMSCDAWEAGSSTIQVELFYWHALIPFSAYQNWKKSGCNIDNPPASCNDLLNEITDMVGPFDPDNLYTDLFTGNGTLGVGAVYAATIPELISTYLNRADVQDAIHANPTKWAACCAEPGQSGAQCGLNYTNHWTNMLPFYNYFFDHAPHLNILIYSGDTDIATCPHAYTQLCLSYLNRKLVDPWTPWVMDKQTAGYREVYDKYTYATIKGAGHEAPLFQPRALHTLLEAFVNGKSPEMQQRKQ